MDGMLSGVSTTSKQRNELLAAVAAEKDDVAFKKHNNVIESFKVGVIETSGLIKMRDEGVKWKSDNPNQRHLKGLRIMFYAIHLRAIGSMSRSLIN
jgi:hypothetical protein